MPFVRGTGLVAQAASVPIVERARLHKRYVSATFATTVVALVVVCLEARSAGPGLLLWIFLGAALLIGLSNSLNALAAKDLAGRMLPADRQTTLAFSQSGLAAVLTVGFALFGKYYINSGGPVGEHIELIWYGVGVFVVAAVVVLMVREPVRMPTACLPEIPPPRDAKPCRYREKFVIALRQSWLRRFVIARMLFMSVELAIPSSRSMPQRSIPPPPAASTSLSSPPVPGLLSAPWSGRESARNRCGW